MNNLKKIGLTALAGSLVATSVAYAGALTATGAAEMKMTNSSQSAAGKTIGMGNSVVLAGSGETDGGLTVSMSFELDAGVDTGTGTGPFDSHSLSIGNDSMGTITVHGHGGSNSASALDGTAAGDLWDSTLGITAANDPAAAASGDNLVVYALPEVMDGLSLSASYASDGENDAGSTAYGGTYTGIEGLSLSYGKGDDSTTKNVDVDQTVMKVSYVYGSFTVGYSSNEYDHTTANSDQETTSFSLAYTVSDAISVTYGEETIEKTGTSSDIEVEGVTASYTSGGMTVALKSVEATNVDYSNTAANNDNEMWKVSLSFAF
jgi:outer membrane protein OmpU